MYSFKRTQKIPLSLDKAWEFLSNPKNLSLLTPKEMNMTILSGADRDMYPGQIIQYSVTPLAGIKTKWVSEITQFKKGKYFVDVQLAGPYAYWHHQHFIHKIEGGVEMEDIITYKVPFGILGKMIHPILVKPKLEAIFRYRQEQLIKLFGEYKG